MSRLGRPQGPVRQALEAALSAGAAPRGAVLAQVCGIPTERARATLKEIHRARRQRPGPCFDALAFMRQAWR